MAYYHATDLGVSVGSAVCGAQSFSVNFEEPVTPIFQLGDVTNCGTMQAPGRGTATLTVNGDVAVVSGTWGNIIADTSSYSTVACPLFGLSSAICTGVTFSGRAGSVPTATYTFSGTGFTTGGGTDPGACGCSVATENISGPTAAYNISATCNVTYLEEFGNANIVQVAASQPRVTATMEYWEGSGTDTSITIGGMSLTLDETLQSAKGGRGSVGGFATYTMTYFGGSEGSATAGLTIA